MTAPHLLEKVEPNYGVQSQHNKLQGTVLLSVVIDQNGKTEDIHVKRSLAPDLDENAIEAVSKWQFAPAMKNGQPVAVRAQIEVNFRLL